MRKSAWEEIQHRPVGVILQDSVGGGTMSGFANKSQKQSRAVILRYGEADGITNTFTGQARAARGVSQIAELVQFVIGGLGTLMTGSGTEAVPAAAQRQARRVQPSSVQPLHGHEKRAGQSLNVSELCDGHCTHRRAGSPVPKIPDHEGREGARRKIDRKVPAESCSTLIQS